MLVKFRDLEEKVRKEVKYAYENTKFFNKHLKDANIDINSISSESDFLRIPPTSKSHYRSNYPVGVLAKGYSLNDKGLYRVKSSGTTTERLETVEVGYKFLHRALNCMSVNKTINDAYTKYPPRHARYAAPNCSDVECANPNSLLEDRVLSDGTLVLSVYHDLLTTPETMLKQNLEEIDQFLPELLYVDPTHLSFLCYYMQEQGYTPRPVPIMSTYGHCTHQSRRNILKTFGADVSFCTFAAMSEIGWLAMECEHNNLHLNTKSYFLELCRDGRAALPNEMAELYVTSLDAGCIPHIRYRTGDLYRYQEDACSCGHQFPVVTFEGRTQNMIFRKGNIVLSPRDVDNALESIESVKYYKLTQASEEDYIFEYVLLGEGEGELESSLKNILKELLGNNISLSINRTQYISSDRSGKFQHCKSNVGEDLVSNGYIV